MPSAPAHYARVKQHLLEGMARGDWAAGARLPSESELVAQFGLSRMTVNRALRELAAEGRITRVAGVGSFVAEPKVQSTLLRIATGRDASDTSFLTTLSGGLVLDSIEVTAVVDPELPGDDIDQLVSLA